MAHLFDNYVVEEEKVYIEGIPCIRLIPKDRQGELPTVIFYHGLSSSKEDQRMRGYMLAFSGFQVFIPDSIHHGERDRKETEDQELVGRYFIQAIIHSVEESRSLIRGIIRDYNVDEDRIYVTGHSMGGFISAGVFTHNENVRGAIPMNGSFDWEASNEIFIKNIGLPRDFYIEEMDRIKELSPRNNVGKLRDREFLILHGEKDQDVSIEPQRDFYRFMQDENQLDVIDMIEQEEVGHFVTTNMMEDLIKWLKDRDI